MNDRLSLTNIMLGLENWQLDRYLPDYLFAFLWKLIMKANSFRPRFPGSFSLTVETGIAMGLGKSRQSINRKQRDLSKVTVNGQFVVSILPGNFGRDIVAQYTINYKMLLSKPSNTIKVILQEQPSQNCDGISQQASQNCDGAKLDEKSDKPLSNQGNVSQKDKNLPSQNSDAQPSQNCDHTTTEGYSIVRQRVVVKDRKLDEFSESEIETIGAIVGNTLRLISERVDKFDSENITDQILDLIETYGLAYVIKQAGYMLQRSNKKPEHVESPMGFLTNACRDDYYTQDLQMNITLNGVEQ